MSSDGEPDEPFRGATYVFDDDTIEIVYEREDGHILTIREYQSESAFERAVEDAEFSGTHDGVASLPDAEEFRDLDV